MSIENIQHRLRSLLDTQNSQIQALINRLSNLKFPPGAIRLDTPEEDDVIAELSNEIQDSLIQQQDDLEILEQEVREIPTRKVIEKESVKASLLRQTTGMRTELKT
jgi:protein transport protein SEC20